MEGVTAEAAPATSTTIHEYDGIYSLPSMGSTHDPTQARESPTAELIRSLSLKVQQCFSERDFAAAYHHAHPHFTYSQERPNRTITLNAPEAQAWMRDVIYKNMGGKNPEIVSTSIDVDERRGVATVWIVLKIFEEPRLNDNGATHVPYACLAPGVERMSVMQWVRNDDFAWKWKCHICLPPVPPMLPCGGE